MYTLYYNIHSQSLGIYLCFSKLMMHIAAYAYTVKAQLSLLHILHVLKKKKYKNRFRYDMCDRFSGNEDPLFRVKNSMLLVTINILPTKSKAL